VRELREEYWIEPSPTRRSGCSKSPPARKRMRNLSGNMRVRPRGRFNCNPCTKSSAAAWFCTGKNHPLDCGKTGGFRGCLPVDLDEMNARSARRTQKTIKPVRNKFPVTAEPHILDSRWQSVAATALLTKPAIVGFYLLRKRRRAPLAACAVQKRFPSLLAGQKWSSY